MSPVLAGAWCPMAAVFAEGIVRDNDGRSWEYVGTDGATHGPFGSAQMNAWRHHGFFANDGGVSMRLTNPPPPPLTHAHAPYGGYPGNAAGGRPGPGFGGGGGGGGPARPTTNKFFVGGLDQATSDASFTAYFSRFGALSDVKVRGAPRSARECGRGSGGGGWGVRRSGRRGARCPPALAFTVKLSSPAH